MHVKDTWKTVLGNDNPLRLLPGLLLAVSVMLSSIFLTDYFSDWLTSAFNLTHSPVSMFLLAIIAGIAVRNLIHLPAIFDVGIKFCMARLLRLGIIFMGIRLSIVAVAKIGAVAVIVTSLCVFFGIVLSLLLARLFGVNNRLAGLIAAGTSICGVSAIVATSPVIDAKEEETAYAISIVTIFGLVAVAAYPYLVELLFGFNIAQAGIFIGTAVHDTSQVTGAALIYDQLWRPKTIADIAITTKLVRNTFLVLVVPILGFFYSRQKSESAEATPKAGLLKYFPVFVLGFIAMAVFRSIGDILVSGDSGQFLFWSAESWNTFCGMVKDAATYLLAVAIAAVGLNTNIRKLAKLSFSPLLAGLAAATAVALISFTLVSILGPMLSNWLVG
jgi:uncharacterized integral membrane protein (TIGR00698 family)